MYNIRPSTLFIQKKQPQTSVCCRSKVQRIGCQTGLERTRATTDRSMDAYVSPSRRVAAKRSGSSILGLLFVGLVLLGVLSNFLLVQKIDLPSKEAKTWEENIPNVDTAQKMKANEPATTEKTNSIHENEIDWSDAIFKRSDLHWDVDPIVIESHKLVFFTVPKNACTVFKQLFRRMMGYSNWYKEDPHDPSRNGLKYLGHFTRDKQLTMMTSPEWTRAIFVRDPLERTLSAYMDKGLGHNGDFVKGQCCDIWGWETKMVPAHKGEFCRKPPFFPYGFPINSTNFPFESFVDHILMECKNTHWNPQHDRLQKASNWKLINFVGKIENRMADTHLMLKQIGAFEEFGASGWGEFHNESIFQSNLAVHKTGSSDKIKQYYTPKLRKRVFEYFREDYEQFNFTIPLDMATTL